jgi:endogenous inhibitor of DNA gyrase (YacG/DUF329 family)
MGGISGTARGGIGYVEHKINVCPECGKQFARNPYSVYGDCCSYTCFRVGDRARRAEIKAQIEAEDESFYARARKEHDRQAAIRERKRKAEETKKLKERVKVCFEKERLYHNKLITLKRGTHEYKNARENWRQWHKKRLAAQEAVERIKDTTK